VACTTEFERAVQSQGYARPAGVDEAGRGCLFGPVYAAAVILDDARSIAGLADSKTLPERRRDELAALIRERALGWAVASASAAEIDRINIREASRLAMRRAVAGLKPACDYLLVDAMTIHWPVPQQALIHGDALSASIAAASILAKVHRDACLKELDRLYPGYGLAQHKGYPTSEHRAALVRLGATPLHRRSYAPVRLVLQATL
jgi:ribonuclease HII